MALLVLLVLVWSVGTSAAAQVKSVQLGQLESDTYILNLNHQLHGKIEWIESTDDEVTVDISSLSHDDIRVDSIVSDYTADITITVKGIDKDGGKGEASHVTGSNHIWILCLSLALTSWPRPLLLSMLLLLLLVHPSHMTDHVTLSADVIIKTPKSFTFKTVNLKASFASIEIAPSVSANTTEGEVTCTVNQTDCPKCCYGHGVCMSGGCQCNNGYYSKDYCKEGPLASIQFHVNPTDPIILTASTVEGERLSLQGSKDEAGNTTKLQGVALTDNTGTEYRVDVHDDLSPESVSTAGVKIKYDWSFSGTVIVSAHTENSGGVVVIKDSTFTRRTARSVDPFNRQRVRRDLTVFINSCAVPVSRVEVWGEGVPAGGGETVRYPGTKQANGLYNIHMPNRKADSAAEYIDDMCGSFKTDVEQACQGVGERSQREANVICPKVSQVLTEKIGAGDLSMITDACRKSFEAAASACDALISAGNAWTKACGSQPRGYDLYEAQGSEVQVTAHVRFYDGTALTTDAQIVNVSPSAGNTPHNFVFDSTEFRLSGIEILPRRPRASVDYRVTVTGLCAADDGTMSLTAREAGSSNIIVAESCSTQSQALIPCSVDVTTGSIGAINDRLTIDYSTNAQNNIYEKVMLIAT